MEVYIGFDISLQATHVCVVNQEGTIIREGVCPSEVPALESWLRTQGKDWAIKRIVFETGQLSTHFYNGLLSPAKVKTLGAAVHRIQV